MRERKPGRRKKVKSHQMMIQVPIPITVQTEKFQTLIRQIQRWKMKAKDKR